MRSRSLTLVLALAVTGWLLTGSAQAELKLATLTVKGMVCQGGLLPNSLDRWGREF